MTERRIDLARPVASDLHGGHWDNFRSRYHGLRGSNGGVGLQQAPSFSMSKVGGRDVESGFVNTFWLVRIHSDYSADTKEERPRHGID